MSRRCGLAVALALCCVAPLRVAPAVAGEDSGFAVAPYLIQVTEDAATVAFHLRQPGAAEVRVFGVGATPRVLASPAALAHFVRITGLAPGQRYRYEVQAGAARTPAGDEGYEIGTACRLGETFSFAVYGDPRPGETGTDRHHREVIEQAALAEPTFALVLGDMVDDGSSADEWERFFGVESELLRRAALFPVLGDNDVAGGEGRYAEYFPGLDPGYYRFRWGGVQFLGLHVWDATGAQPEDELARDGAQHRWLEAELARPEVRDAPFRVVFLHDPVMLSRGPSADVLREVWAPLLAQSNVDLVFASWHLYERSRHDGVTYVVSGGGGAELIWINADPDRPSLAEARRHHFCLVEVSEGAMSLRAIADDGTVLDAITLTPREREAAGEPRVQRAARRLGTPMRIDGGSGAPELELLLFSHDCAYCRRLLGDLLPGWARGAGVTLNVRYYDLSRRGTYDLLMSAGGDFGRQDAELPTVFLGQRVLGGQGEIEAQLLAELGRFRERPAAYREQAIQPFGEVHDTRQLRELGFEALTVGLVLGAGLLDGVNPCAFTTVIFLVSYLTLVGGSRRKILLTGGLFTAAVFVTYLVIGLAFYRVAGWLTGDRALATVVNGLLLAAVGLLAALSLVDGVRCLKGQSKDMALQLPEFIKRRIRGRIRGFARSSALAGGAAIVLGVVIAGMELVCTGQVYLPIVTMISEPEHRAGAFALLLLYNIAFVIPLLVVFLLSALGVTSQRMARFFSRHVAAVKFGLAGLFLVMATVLLGNLV